ncbi:MAG: DUF3108 domain-containing protein [Crocinitomicaceae bacterium]|nr:DUF3108 domain-containing protein [Crocinitomicaceae bacterium]
MSLRITLLSIGLMTAMIVVAQTTKPAKVKLDYLPVSDLREINNHAFKSGEKVTYRIHYGLINAGTATITVKDSPFKFGTREAYHVVGEGRSLGTFDWFFKVRDRYETYIDKQGIFPYRFIRNCDEGGYRINQDYTFAPEKKAYTDMKGNSYMTAAFMQDMLSSYFYARTVDYSTAKKGDIFTVMTLIDDEIYPLKMKYIGKETIEIGSGKFRCIRFAPVVQKGRVFKKEEDLSVWISDDANHLPVLAKAKIMVGSIKMELTDYSGLANPIAKEN